MLLRKCFDALVKTARRIIGRSHKITSGIKLRDIVLFGSTPDFGDSTVEVFDLISRMDEFAGYKLIWFCASPKKLRHKNNGRVSVKKRIDNPVFRLVNLYLESSARYTVYTHELIGNMYSEAQTRVFIEHGGYSLKRARHEGGYSHYDLCTYRVRAIENKNPRCRALGLPRNDRLFDDPAAAKKALGIDGYDRVFIWTPTFKRYKFRSMFHLERNDYGVKKDFDISLQEDGVFYDIVDSELRARNALLILKYHPSQDMKYVLSKETPNIKIISDEALLNAGVKLYSLLGATDALITDFSSIAYDYLLVNKPIGFDITDLELYMKGGSISVENPLEHMPGEKITDVGGFRDFIAKTCEGRDDFTEERKKMLDRIHVYQDNQSAKRVVELMLERNRKNG